MSMGQMSVDAFLYECNQSPTLKNFRSDERPITHTILEEADFIKPLYTLADLSTLANLLYFIEPYVPKKLKLNKSSFKDLIHWYEIGKLHNQKLIVGLRKRIGMSCPNRGFKIDKDFLPLQVQDHGIHYTNTFIDDGFSEEYKDWFYKTVEGLGFYDEHEKWETATANVRSKLDEVIEEVLRRWKLPLRYKSAVEELILFNRIIPAPSGIKWESRREHIKSDRFTESIVFDVDTTKTQLIDEIKGSSMVRLGQKYMQGKRRKYPRKLEETNALIAEYNKLLRLGKPDKDIFVAIRANPKFRHLKVSAIRKRIKG